MAAEESRTDTPPAYLRHVPDQLDVDDPDSLRAAVDRPFALRVLAKDSRADSENAVADIFAVFDTQFTLQLIQRSKTGWYSGTVRTWYVREIPVVAGVPQWNQFDKDLSFEEKSKDLGTPAGIYKVGFLAEREGNSNELNVALLASLLLIVFPQAYSISSIWAMKTQKHFQGRLKGVQKTMTAVLKQHKGWTMTSHVFVAIMVEQSACSDFSRTETAIGRKVTDARTA